MWTVLELRILPTDWAGSARSLRGGLEKVVRAMNAVYDGKLSCLFAINIQTTFFSDLRSLSIIELYERPIDKFVLD